MPVAINIEPYNPGWPDLYHLEAGRIQTALGDRALQLEHTGSTSVPGLPAKPIIDILLAVADSAAEDAYVPALESAGYVLRIREPGWYQHRMFNARHANVNLHVFSAGCPEIDRILLFRDWLRNHPADRGLYAQTKLALARQEWNSVDDYANAKTEVIGQIIGRAIRR